MRPLTDQDMISIKRASRLSSCMRKLGMTEIRRAITFQLLLAKRPLTITSVAEITGYSRRSIKEWLEDGVARGSVEKVNGHGDNKRWPKSGYQLTYAGRLLVVAMITEALDMAYGKTEGFSDEFIDYLRSFKLDTDRPLGDLKEVIV